MNPKTLLIVSLVMGGLAVGLLQVQTRKADGGVVKIFQATKSLDAGATLKDAYKPVQISKRQFEPIRGYLPSDDLEGWVASSKLVRAIRSGETVTYDHLGRSADDGVRSQIAPGMRAIAIEVNAASAVGYHLRPGDLVDVLGSIPNPVTGRMPTKTLLQAKKVLAVGEQYRPGDSIDRSFSTVTLEVSPDEAKKIVAARGLIREGFTLDVRAPGDRTKVPAQGEVDVYSDAFDLIGNQ